MGKIWESNNKSQFNEQLHSLCFQTNLEFDQKLIPYDLKALKAHCSMIFNAQYLIHNEKNLLNKCLQELMNEYQEGKFKITEKDEDCHSLIEEKLIERCGNTGKKLYMARSRNDQIVQALRLYALDELKKIEQKTLSFAKELLDFSKKYEKIPMPGYTHTQRAMPSSIGLWISSYLEVLLEQKSMIQESFNKNSVAVLGTAAGYGTSFDVQRKIIQKELNLKRTQVNSMACQLSRGQVECQTLQSLWGIMFVLNRLSNDLIWLSSQEFSFIKPNEVCVTGSSIMPQKKNLDPCEIVRGKYHLFNGYINQIQGIISNLFLGYHSDYQETKAPFINGLSLVYNCLKILIIVIKNVEIDEEATNKAISPELFSTDLVNQKVKEGMSFKDAYHEVKNNLNKLPNINPKENLEEKTMLGSSGNLGLEFLEKILISWEKEQLNV